MNRSMVRGFGRRVTGTNWNAKNCCFFLLVLQHSFHSRLLSENDPTSCKRKASKRERGIKKFVTRDNFIFYSLVHGTMDAADLISLHGEAVEYRRHGH